MSTILSTGDRHKAARRRTLFRDAKLRRGEDRQELGVVAIFDGALDRASDLPWGSTSNCNGKPGSRESPAPRSHSSRSAPSRSHRVARTPSSGCAPKKLSSCRSSSSSERNVRLTSLPPCKKRVANRRSLGISSLQGPHHAAQRLIQVHLPAPLTAVGARDPLAAFGEGERLGSSRPGFASSPSHNLRRAPERAPAGAAEGAGGLGDGADLGEVSLLPPLPRFAPAGRSRERPFSVRIARRERAPEPQRERNART